MRPCSSLVAHFAPALPASQPLLERESAQKLLLGRKYAVAFGQNFVGLS